jgi:outer membrane beta-barrel protein
MKLAVSLLAIALLSPLAAAAEESQEAGRLVAIQQRKFRMAHELEIGGMFEPLDAFSKGIGAEGAYVLHLDDTWSWEVVRAGYVARIDTSLRTQLLRDFGVDPTAFESLQYYASSSAIFAPLYGKFALRNASLVHLEMFLTAGGAFGHFTTLYAAGPELGVGARLFLSQTMSVRLDARDAFFIARKKENVLFFSLGLSINLGGND